MHRYPSMQSKPILECNVAFNFLPNLSLNAIDILPSSQTQQQDCSSFTYVSGVIMPDLDSQTNIASAYITINCQIIDITTNATVDVLASAGSLLQSVLAT